MCGLQPIQAHAFRQEAKRSNLESLTGGAPASQSQMASGSQGAGAGTGSTAAGSSLQGLISQVLLADPLCSGRLRLCLHVLNEQRNDLHTAQRATLHARHARAACSCPTSSLPASGLKTSVSSGGALPRPGPHATPGATWTTW